MSVSPGKWSFNQELEKIKIFILTKENDRLYGRVRLIMLFILDWLDMFDNVYSRLVRYDMIRRLIYSAMVMCNILIRVITVLRIRC